jgi:hypothetical protein
VGYIPRRVRGYTEKMQSELTKNQLQTARIISGAYRVVLIPPLDIELFMVPIRQQLEKRASEAVLTIRMG